MWMDGVQKKDLGKHKPRKRKAQEMEDENSEITGRVGGVLFAKHLPAPLAFVWDVPKQIGDKWKERENQILMVEGIAPHLALRTYRRYLQGRAGYVFSDNISVESILVKGYTPEGR